MTETPKEIKGTDRQPLGVTVKRLVKCKAPLDWIPTATGEMPDIADDVLCMNVDSGDCEFGFRSGVDTDDVYWADFSFPVTHWAYANFPADI